MTAPWKWLVATLLLAPIVSAASDLQPGVRPGPVKVELGHELTLDMPEDYVFLEPSAAAELLKQRSFSQDTNLLGAVISKEPSPWLVLIEYNGQGYIQDDEELDAEKLLATIKAGEEDFNLKRMERGLTPIWINEYWAEEPRYDRAQHHLAWALFGSTLHAAVLGRRGFVKLSMVGTEGLRTGKAHLMTLVRKTSFNAGARYEDFKKDTDKVAEYGLEGPILGGPWPKRGKFALLVGFLFMLVGLVLTGRKLLVRKR